MEISCHPSGQAAGQQGADVSIADDRRGQGPEAEGTTATEKPAAEDAGPLEDSSQPAQLRREQSAAASSPVDDSTGQGPAAGQDATEEDTAAEDADPLEGSRQSAHLRQEWDAASGREGDAASEAEVEPDQATDEADMHLSPGDQGLPVRERLRHDARAEPAGVQDDRDEL